MIKATLAAQRGNFTALALAIALTGCSQSENLNPAASTAEPTHQAHDAHADHGAAPAPAEGQRFASDEPLRAAMLRIRAQFDPSKSAYAAGVLQPEDARALADTVDREIAYMVANCRLEPEPDAALHGLIGRMVAAAQALRGEPQSPKGVPGLEGVLHDYQNTFDHPGWQSLATETHAVH